MSGTIKTLVETANRSRDMRFSWLRWLTLLAAGFFSLMSGQLLGKPWVGLSLWSLKAALTLNLLGILALAVALFEEAAGLRRLVSALRAAITLSLTETGAAMPQAPLSSNASIWSRVAEWLGYFCLAASLAAWLLFVLLI